MGGIRCTRCGGYMDYDNNGTKLRCPGCDETPEEAYARGRADERADVVAVGRTFPTDLPTFLDTVENAQHVDAAKKEKP